MLADLFDRIPFFQGLSAAQRNLLRPLFIPCDCYGGTILFEQGDPAEHLFLVISGEVIIRYKPEDGPEITLAKVRPGGAVGWSSILGRQVYTSVAQCSIFSQVLRVRGEDLQRLCDQYPDTGEEILKRLAGVLAERLGSTTNDQVADLLKQGLAYGH
jgi:NTE family protein